MYNVHGRGTDPGGSGGVYDLPFTYLASLSHGRTQSVPSFSWSGCVRERSFFYRKVVPLILRGRPFNSGGGGGWHFFGNKYSKKTNNLTSTFLEWGGGTFFKIFRLALLATVKFSNNFPARFARIKFLNNVVHFYLTLNTYTYNVSMNIYHCRLYISIQIYMFQNGQPSEPTLLWWHDIQAHVSISNNNCLKWHHFVRTILKHLWGRTPDPLQSQFFKIL